MTVTRLLGSVLVVALPAPVAVCSASSAPDGPTGTATGSPSAGTRRSADPEPVAVTLPDVIGGDAGRAYERMGSELGLTFEDASGQGRPVDDPAAWKICGSQPDPNQRITGFPVVLDVVKVAESCWGTELRRGGR
ncbi:hypothetical protein ACH4F6_29830 [Streptomyces sp. NPDC017936]|uniref:hypothetical protein n=1 Tax=Streptomyces sp. NPDC017936 TaxID=3365016 RepID=UPI0037AEB27A